MNVPKDKLLHAGMGAATAVATIVLVLISDFVGLAITGLIAAILLGVAYELQQKLRGEGSPEFKDAFATALGGAVVALATTVVLQIF